MIKVTIETMIDPAQYREARSGRAPLDTATLEILAARIVATLIEGSLGTDTDGTRVVASQAVDDDYALAWSTALVTIGGRPFVAR